MVTQQQVVLPSFKDRGLPGGGAREGVRREEPLLLGVRMDKTTQDQAQNGSAGSFPQGGGARPAAGSMFTR